MLSSYFNAKKVFEFSSACTSIARLRFISSVPAVLNLKFGTREAAAHFFFFFFLFPAQKIPSRAKYYTFASRGSGRSGVFKFNHK